MKTRVINLVGASGSGKTTIAKELDKLGFNVIQSYTTRPPRYEGEWGHTFISTVHPVRMDSDFGYLEYGLMFMNRIYRSNMIAYFNSYDSGHHYFATDEQVIRGKDNIYIVDPNGANQVKEFYQNDDQVEVITVFLDVDEGVRAERLAQRVPDKTVIKYHNYYKQIPEVWKRLLPDRELFKDVDYDIRVDGNGPIEETVNNILKEVGNKDERNIRKHEK